MVLQQSVDRFQGTVQSLGYKAPCVAVATSNIADLEGLQSVDGFALQDGDRVLLVAQTDPIENGIWVVKISDWFRGADMDGNRDVTRGSCVNVNRSTGTSAVYEVTTIPNPRPGVDPINFRLWYDSAFTAPGYAFCDFTICNQVVGSVGGTATINYRIGQGVTLNLTEDITNIVFQNVPGSDVAQLEFDVRQDSTPRTVAWPGTIKWVNGTAPDISTADSITQIHLRTTDGGLEWLGTYSENHA